MKNKKSDIDNLDNKKGQAGSWGNMKLVTVMLVVMVIIFSFIAMYNMGGLDFLKNLNMFGGDYTPGGGSGGGSGGSGGGSVNPLEEPVITIGAVCEFLGVSGMVKSFKTMWEARKVSAMVTQAVDIYNAADDVVVRGGTVIGEVSASGNLVTSLYKIKNINDISYVVNDAGKIIGRVGDAAKIVPIEKGIELVAEKGTGVSVQVVEHSAEALAKLRVPGGAALLKAGTETIVTTAEKAGALIPKEGVLKFIAASSRYAAFLKVVSKANIALSVTSAVCDAGLFVYAAEDWKKAMITLDESERETRQSIEKQMLAVEDTYLKLRGVEQDLWANYEAGLKDDPAVPQDVKTLIESIHNRLQNADMHALYLKFKTAGRDFINYIGDGSPEEGKKWLAFQTLSKQFRTSIVSIYEDMDKVQAKLSPLVNLDPNEIPSELSPSSNPVSPASDEIVIIESSYVESS